MQKRSKRRLFRLAALALAVAVTVVLIEGLAAVALHVLPEVDDIAPQELRDRVVLTGRACQTRPDPWLQYRVEPSQKSRYANVNRLGLRGPETTQQPASDTVRVVITGGSVTWGYTSRSDDDTIAAYLEQHLEANAARSELLRGKKVEVLNAGVPAYVSWQEALYYDLHLRRLGASIIVALDGTNDAYAGMRTGQAGVPMRYDLTRQAYRDRRPSLLGAIGSWASARLERMKFMRLVRRVNPPSIDDLAVADPAAVAIEHRAALTHLVDVAAKEGARVLVALQPMAVLPGAKELTEFETQALECQRARIVGSGDYFTKCYEAFRRELAELEKQRPDARVFDATGIYAQEKGIIFIDDCHLTPEGRQILARAIGEQLIAAW